MNVSKIIFVLIAISSSLMASPTKEELYKMMKDKQTKSYPIRFEAQINGEIVDKQIATIPTSKISGNKDNIILKFYFKQNETPSLVLENVDSFYRTMFSVFDGVLATTGCYVVVGVNKDYTSFSKAFLIESVSDAGTYYKALARGKGKNTDYSVEYHINKETMLVYQAIYFFKNARKYNVSIEYQDIENYKIPKTLIYKSSDGVVNSSISFNNVKTFSK